MDKNELLILIVEDDFIIAENLKENLSAMGYGYVIHGSNSDEGIKLYKKHKPDLCLVDIHLAGSELDGIEMVHKHKLGENVPVIYLTAFADDTIRERALRTKPAGYLIKPSSKVQIDVAIDVALNNYYQSQQQEESVTQSKTDTEEYKFFKVKNKDYERYEKVFLKDIIFLKAEGSYTRVYMGTKMSLLSMNLTKTLEMLNIPDLIRCHRSFAVNLLNVHSVDQNFFYVLNNAKVEDIPISEQYKSKVNSRIQRL